MSERMEILPKKLNEAEEVIQLLVDAGLMLPQAVKKGTPPPDPISSSERLRIAAMLGASAGQISFRNHDRRTRGIVNIVYFDTSCGSKKGPISPLKSGLFAHSMARTGKLYEITCLRLAIQ